jgi:putative chitinase
MLSADILRRLYPSAEQVSIDIFVAQAPALLPEFEISTARDRLHFFLAQMGHESGGLCVRRT